MKLTATFVFFALIVMVKGTWQILALQPVILSLGALLGAIDHGLLDGQLFEWKNLFKFSSKQKAEALVSKNEATSDSDKLLESIESK